MNTKKILSISVLCGLFILNTLPVYAINENKNSKIEAEQDENIYQTINLAWWQSFDDDNLTGYIHSALQKNQDLKIATLRVEQARQNVKLQFANELPSLQAGVSPALTKFPDAVNTSGSFSVPIVVNYEIDLFLKNHDKTKSVKKLLEVEKYNEQTVYISVSSEIGSTYFNIVKLDKLIELQNEIIQDRKQIFELMKIRNSQGLTSTADLTKAEKSYVLSVADLSDLEKSREVLLNSLAVLTGESPNNISEMSRISYDELVKIKEIPNSVSSNSIINRPDYKVSEKMIEKAGLDVRIAKKEFLPSINLLGAYSFNSFNYANSMNWENALAVLGGAAMLDIFRGGAKIANLKLKKNYYEQILQNYQKTNLVAMQEINNALCYLKNDKQKFDSNLKSYNMQNKDYGFSKIKYSDGLISKLDLIQQKETLLTMNKMVVNSKTDCFINQISLYKAVGGKL